MIFIKSQKTTNLNGEINIPGDKSISHRSLILSSCAFGLSKISNLLESEDVLSTLNALKKLGVKIEKRDDSWFIKGQGLGSFTGINPILNLRNSGTGTRLLMGIVAGSDIEATFIGDDSLSTRPMKRVIDPLILTGAQINSNFYKLPVKIKGSKIPLPNNYFSNLSSAQVKSAVLLAGLTSTGTTNYHEPILSRDHTERMLSFMGANIKTKQLKDQTWKISLQGLPNLKKIDLNIPNDPSSAAFPIVASLITPDSNVLIKKVLMSKLRTGLIQTLIEMGAKIEIFNKMFLNGEETADLKVKTSKLHGIEVPAERVPSMIDEYPILSIAACFAKGQTIMNGVEELKFKETDRIKETVENLNKIGIKANGTNNKITVVGSETNTLNGGVEIDSKLDHRIAMSFLCLGLKCKKPITVFNAETINSSFPNFYSSMKKIGANFNQYKDN